MKFSDRLKQLREEAGLSQEELGEKVKLSKSNISKYESGALEPNHETLILFSNIFSVSLDYLLGKTDNRDPFTTIAAHRTDDPTDELPEEARKSLEEFKDYILKKYGYKE